MWCSRASREEDSRRAPSVTLVTNSSIGGILDNRRSVPIGGRADSFAPTRVVWSDPQFLRQLPPGLAAVSHRRRLLLVTETGRITGHHVDSYRLNDAQWEVLRWIADGCPQGRFDGYAHRLSAAALRSRGLIRI